MFNRTKNAPFHLIPAVTPTPAKEPESAVWNSMEATVLLLKLIPIAARAGYELSVPFRTMQRPFFPLLEVVMTPLLDNDELPNAMEFFEEYEADNKEFVWSFKSRIDLGEKTVLNYWDFHTEKPMTFTFVTETNLNR